MSPKVLPLAAAVLLTLAAFPLLPASAAEATTPISVKVNMARILRISSPATTVIVGNPAVADVTIQDPMTLVLTGKSYGQTNLIVLDTKGNPIADTLVQVEQSQADTVTMFNAGARATLSCSPKCSPMVMVGDDPSYTQTIVQSMGLVSGVAQ